MIFNSHVYLLLFLPIAMIGYWLLQRTPLRWSCSRGMNTRQRQNILLTMLLTPNHEIHTSIISR